MIKFTKFFQTDEYGIVQTIVSSLGRGGWTIDNMIKTKFQKPGVLIEYD